MVATRQASGSGVALALVRACHPGPTATVTAIAVALAVGAGQRQRALVLGAAVLAGQLSVGWSNDLLDEERDRGAGRTDKPIATGDLPRGTARGCTALAVVGCVACSLAVGWWAGAVHLLAVASGWAYNVALKKGPFSVVPYAVAFGALPLFVSFSLPGRPWPASWTVPAASLLGAGAHFVNVLPDLDADRATGVRGLPQRLGATGSLAVGATSMAASLALIARMATPSGAAQRAAVLIEVAGAAAVLAMIVAAARGSRRVAWRLALVSAATVTAAFLVSGASALR